MTASFAGDGSYLPSQANRSVLLYAAPSSGAFLLGDRTMASATASSTLTFWGATWAGSNQFSGGSAPDAFKGYADTVTLTPSCGGTFTTRPGNSSRPPDSIPGYMEVLVTNQVSKSGSTISGTIVKIVIVKTNPGYAGNPGHPGTGSIVATLCG
jgi:hypothetical protein